MLTRRNMLLGTADASIAAIACGHGVAAAAGSDTSGVGLGDLAGGALGAFHKRADGFGVFLTWQAQGAEIFYKQTAPNTVGVFLKFFNKGWTPVTTTFLKATTSLTGADAHFGKIHTTGAEFFVKGENGVNVISSFTPTPVGVEYSVQEEYTD